MKNKVKFPITVKVSIFIIVLSVISLVGSSYYLYKKSDNVITQMIQQQFNQALNMAENHFDLLKNVNTVLVNNLSKDHEFLSIFKEKNQNKLQYFIDDKLLDIECDEIIVLDNMSDIIVQSGSLPYDGNTLRNLEIVSNTLNQQKQFSTITRQFDVFVLYASSPIIIDNKYKGMVLIGFSLNHTMMKNIKKDTILEFSIIGDRIVAATSFEVDGKKMESLPMPYIDYLWLLKSPNEYYESVINGKNYYLTAKELKNLDKTTNASIMMAYPSGLLHFYDNELFDSLLITLVSTISVTVILVVFYGREIQKLLYDLIDQTKRISKGDYKHTIVINTNDEFEILAHNFNVMTQSLKEQRETIKEYTNSLEQKVNQRTIELTSQKQALEQILDLNPSMILSIEFNLVIYANRAFLDYFNVNSVKELTTKEQLYALFNTNMIDREKYDDIKKFITSLLVGYNNELELYRANGEKNVFEVEFFNIDIPNDKYMIAFQDVSRLRSENQQLEQQVMRDNLTGIYNRNKLNSVLEKIIYTDKVDTMYSLIICDIDNFKKINDTYGHVVGDYALVTLSQLFSENIGEKDILARWGGEEFVILCENKALKEAEKFANNLRSELSKIKFDYFGSLTCSFGVTQVLKGDTINSLIERADRGLYFSKNNGKNMVSII